MDQFMASTRPHIHTATQKSNTMEECALHMGMPLLGSSGSEANVLRGS